MQQASPSQFSGIFISYRRDDSSGHAGRLFDKLSDHFGKDRIFMDIDTIEPGEDFVTVIENAVGSCEILIAVIGRNWLSGTSGTTGRLDNPNDFVRVEIATALRRDIRVIPVLVQRAAMPKPQDLPEDLARLTRRNAVELGDNRWHTDVDELIGVMEKLLAKKEQEQRNAEQQEEAERQRHEAEVKLDDARQLEAEEAARQSAERRKREAEEKGARHRSEEALPGIGSVEVHSIRAKSARSKRVLIIGAVISLLVVLATVGVWLRRVTQSNDQGSTSGANVSLNPSVSAAPTATPPTKTESPGAPQTNTASSNRGNANKSVAVHSSSRSANTAKSKPDNGAAARQKCALAALKGQACTP